MKLYQNQTDILAFVGELMES